MPTAQDKRHDFLWLVQLFMLRKNDVIGWHGHAGDAIAASYRIPAKMTARDAALDYWAFVSEEFRGGRERECPSWITNLKDPTYS